MKIAMDLDEVIADFMSALLDFYYLKKGKRHSVSEFKEYKWWPVWGMEKEESIKLVDEFHDTYKLDEIKLVEGALEVISNLMKNGNEIYVITARPSRFKKKVESWIKHHIKTNKIKSKLLFFIFSKFFLNSRLSLLSPLVVECCSSVKCQPN